MSETHWITKTEIETWNFTTGMPAKLPRKTELVQASARFDIEPIFRAADGSQHRVDDTDFISLRRVQ